VWYASAALLTIAMGLLIHRGVMPLAAVPRDVVGDALWAAMIYWWIGVVRPGAYWQARAAWAVAVCWLVEVAQLAHTPSLDAFRATTVGHLVLGSGFDPRDLLAYAVGVLLAALLDRRAQSGGRAGVGIRSD
jgi:hypothetical protein